MNELYRKELKTNTLLFGIGEVCTKVLQYFVALFLSFFLTTQESGDIALIRTSSSLIIPLVSLDIIEAVFRFSADKNYRKNSVFTTGLLFSFVGLMLLAPATFILNRLFGISTPVIVYLFIALLMIHNIIHYFVKGIGRVKLYVINSVFFALGTCAATLFCLYLFRGGIKTFFLCYIFTYLFCIIFMFIFGRLWSFISFKSVDKTTIFEMCKYSTPLIVNTIGWWLISASDTYITNYFMGNGAVGILSYSHKFPTILNSIYSIFGMAFQLLAISKFCLENKEEKSAAESSFSTTLNKLIVVLGFFVLLIITFTEPMIKLFVNRDYYDSWRYVPIYTFGMFFFVLSTFFGYIYNIKKNNVPLLISTIICGLCNIGLCILFFIIFKNLFAAALSTLISYFIVFVFRLINSRRILKTTISSKTIFVFVILLLVVVLNSLIHLSSKSLFTINFILLFLFLMAFKNEIFEVLKISISKN